jgi:curli biogenesis system outer membrane secretion channel CsgG
MRVMPNQAFVALTSCLLASCLAGGAFAQKATMAVRGFQATPAVEAAAAASGTLNALNQIMQGAQSQLENAIQTGGKFDIVARADLASILKEQDLAASGLVDTLSPGAARSLQLAGARYLAILNVDGFQDVTDTTVLQKQLGATRAERRTIQLSGVVKVFDTTSGKIIASIALKMNQSQLDEVMPGVERDGRKTQALLAEVATKLGRDSSLSITDSVFPAKVVAYTVGQITFNRVKSSGVAVGQIWEVMHAGQELIDPDTGTSLGREQLSVGWARVIDAGDRFSRAEAIVDNGIANGDVMALRPAGLPAGMNTSSRAGGSSQTSAAGDSRGVSQAASGSKINNKAAGSELEIRGRTLAIFTRNLASTVPPKSTAVLEADLAACLAGSGASIISRSDVVNGVAAFAGDSANSGGSDYESRAVEQALSDQSSALRLAQLLGADGIIIATITNYTNESRDFNDETLGVKSSVRSYSLGVACQILSGDNGASVFGGTLSAARNLKDSADLTERTNPIDGLLRDASEKVCLEVARNAGAMASITPSASIARSSVEVTLVASGLEIPDIVINGDGESVVGSTRLPLSPVGARIYIDGVLSGAAPNTLSLSQGVHRLRIDHPLFSSLEEIVNVRGGEDVQSFTFAMVLSPEGRLEWERNVEILESLKTGEVLREETLIRVRAFAEFLRNSRVDIDTSEVRNLNLGGRTFWGQVLGE